MTKRLWTPGGEMPVGDEGPEARPPGQPGGAEEPAGPRAGEAAGEAVWAASGRQAGVADEAGAGPEPTEEELRAYLEQLRKIPVKDLVVNEALSLYQIAALHLHPDGLDEASLAIDTLAGLVEAAGERLGGAKAELDSILSHLRMDFVAASRHAGEEPPSGPPE